MSSDGYFEGDDFDDAAFDELDAIEAAALKPSATHTAHSPTAPSENDSFYDLTLDIDESDLQKIDDFVKDAYGGKVKPVTGSSWTRTRSATHQTTLFGDVLSPSPAASTSRSQMQRTKSAPRNPFGRQAPKTKVWDQTAFAKTGLKSGKSKGKGKTSYDDDGQEEEDVEFEQFPAPFVSGKVPLDIPRDPPPMKLHADLLEAKHWIYPLNRPKRDYQFNIVKRCLFDNTIVALPTGLGKTFIAGVIMLNYYRWFPEGKVVFVAPTKPLVAQQIEACHQTCGIPGCDAAELTGQIAKTARGRLWREKRVFYMTPQTLVNDLTSENCDVRDIVLLVIDEAHRATGDYAYNQVVRFLMAKNPHFRILALTATPGGNPDAVQNLIDGLHISHIEIRDENSLDLKQYIHHKRIEQHIINMTEEVNKVKEPLAALMNKDLHPLRQRGIVFGSPDPVRFHPYAAQAQMSKLKQDQRWAYTPLSRLSNLARAMGYLIEGTLGMCHTYIQELSRQGDEEVASGSGKTSAAASRKKGLREDPMFQAVLRELNNQRACGFSVHPKMDRLKTLIIEHFAQKIPDNEEAAPDDTRVMVFVTFREAVDEIVDTLNAERPLIRAHKFIGQGTDKQGKKGLAQKEQLDVIQRFKAGELNVLVATSIGEEGLDIGEVDLIVCYDAQKTPIRMLQRLGRTGRKREGVVHVLLAEGREELNLEKAKDTYKEVQKTILRGEQLELYSDVPRLLPDHVKPECLEKAMEIQEYIRDEGKKKATKENRSPTAGTKRKRNDDISRNIPAGASTGFVSVAELLVKGPKKQKRTKALSLPRKDFEAAGEDDGTDEDIESGIVSAAPPRRTRSSVPSTSKSSDKGMPRRAKTKVPKASKKKKNVELSSSQFSSKGVDDMDDMDIERGLVAPLDSLVSCDRTSSRPNDTDERGSSPCPTSSSNAVIDLTDSEDDHSPTHPLDNIATPHDEPDQSMAWLIDEDEDDNPSFEIVDSSPILNRSMKSGMKTIGRPLPDSDQDKSIEFVDVSDPPNYQHSHKDSDSIEFVGSSTGFVAASSVTRMHQPSSPLWPESSSPLKPIMGRKRSASSTAMPPPVMPRRPPLDSPEGMHIPEPSFPVRPPAGVRRRPFIDSPSIEMSSPAPRRLHRRTSPKSHQHKPRPKVDARRNPVFDFEAEHSGDEVSEGSSGPEDEETEEDRRFLQELPETQASPSYNQSLAYRQSLFTQAPMGAKAPNFANAPLRRGIFGAGSAARRRLTVSSSPRREDDGPDDYMLGSFVVDDDAEISYLSDD
ncbi:hypothetical protein DXG01_000002 [Tephrocybe rancida]|nr:hypothetical protein DXG01_000002 [Tephrocybe rancida]